MSNVLDSEVVELVNALNTFPGVETTSSCCGHGNDVFNIWFAVDDLDDLPEMLYHIDVCHSGVGGWSVEVTTDCGMSPVHFRLHSETKGEAAYSEATKLAKIMMQYEEKT
jgi:hypothetical protein